MNRLKVHYLFRRPVSQDLKKADQGKIPHDYFFAYTRLSKKFSVTMTEKVFSNKIVSIIDQLIIKATYPIMNIGFSFFSVAYQLPEIRKADVLFATTDSFGIPLLLLKQLKIINKPIIINTGGFFDGYKESKSQIYRKMCRKLFGNVSIVVSGVKNECKLMSRDLHLPKSKLAQINYGVDTSYFKPKFDSEIKQDFILTENLPKIKFVIIASPDQLKIKMPDNVKILYNLPIGEVRAYIRKSLLIVILSKQNYRFAGSSTILRAMSCAKTVIFTDSYGVLEQPFVNNKNAILVPPHNYKKIVSEIKRLIKNKKEISKIGDNARKYVLKNNNYKHYTSRLEKVFRNSLLNEKND